MATLMYVLKREDKKLYQTILPMLDASAMVSFYLLVEPLKGNNGAEYIIPGYILAKCRTKNPNPLRQWKSNFKNMPNHDEMYDLATNLRQDLIGKSAKEQLNRIKKDYNKFDQGEDLAELLPQATREFYQHRPGLKKWQDGARFLLRECFKQDSSTRRSLIRSLFDRYNPENMNTIVTDPNYYRRVSSDMYQSLAAVFIASDLYMYFPSAPRPSNEDESDDEYDLSAEAWEEQENMLDDPDQTQNNIENQLMVLKESDPERYERLMSKFQQKHESPFENVEDIDLEKSGSKSKNKRRNQEDGVGFDVEDLEESD